jgi:DNA-binding Xre family transcriptional regulator
MAIGAASTALLSAHIASTALGIKSTKQASKIQQKQIENQKLQQRIAASEATSQRLDQMGKAITTQTVSSAAAGLSPESNQILNADRAQTAVDDISAIDFNLESQLAQLDIQQKSIDAAAKASKQRDILGLGISMFDTLQLN